MKYSIFKFTYGFLHYFFMVCSLILSIYMVEYYELNKGGVLSWVLLFVSWIILYVVFNVIFLQKILFKGFIKENVPSFWFDDLKGYYGWPEDIEDWNWLDVSEVEIITTDEGPWREDLYWVISFKNSRECIVIPQLAEGGNSMLEAIPKILGEPDWMMATEAMGSCVNNRFLIWSADPVFKEVDKHAG